MCGAQVCPVQMTLNAAAWHTGPRQPLREERRYSGKSGPSESGAHGAAGGLCSTG